MKCSKLLLASLMTTAFSVTTMKSNVDAKVMSGYANKKTAVYKNSGLTKKVGTLRKFKTVKYGNLHKNKSNKKIRYIKSSKLKGYVISKNISKTKYGSYDVGDYRYYWKNHKSNLIKAEQIKNSNENNQISDTEYINRAQSKAFSILNQERTKRGLQQLNFDDELEKLSSKRAFQIQSYYSHFDSSGNSIQVQLAKEMNIKYSKMSENIFMTKSYKNDPEGWAKYALHEFIYDDASANWGHRDSLLSPDFNNVAIGINRNDVTESIAINLRN